jgi:Tol biopolymer transport system component
LSDVAGSAHKLLGILLATAALGAVLPGAQAVAGPIRDGRIYYDVQTGNYRHGAIYSVARSGGDRKRFANPTSKPIGVPQVDEHGNVLFQSLDRIGGSFMYLESADGSEWRRLNEKPDAYGAAFCGVNGNHIVWIKGESSHVIVMRADGTHKEDVPHTSFANSAVCTPNGHHVVIARDATSDSHMFVDFEHLDGSHLRHLVTLPRTVFPSSVTVAPNGRTIAYSTLRRRPHLHLQIYKIKLGSSQPQRLTPRTEFDGFPSFAPHGGGIVFHRETAGGRIFIATMHRDGSHKRRVSGAIAPRRPQTRRLFTGDPFWAPALGR